MSIRVLLAEPDEDLRNAYSEAFRHSELDLLTVASADQALEALDRTAPDVLVTEIGGGQLGARTFSAVLERDPDLPVVLLTPAPELESAMMAVNLGAYRYLVKPVAPSTLERIVRRAALLRGLARATQEAAFAAEIDEGSRHALAMRFSEEVDAIGMAYQPIVGAHDNAVRGFEALLRPRGNGFSSPDSLLRVAQQLDRTRDLGRAVRQRVANDARELPDGATLFVNLLPTDLLDPELFDPESPLAPLARRVVLELTERSPLDAIADLSGRVARLRGMGFRIALDDIGAGYSGLASLTQLEPDLIKLDRALVRHVDESTHRQAVVRSLVELCRSLRIGLVGEGVEVESEAEALRALDVEQLQGFFFATPAPASRWSTRLVS